MKKAFFLLRLNYRENTKLFVDYCNIIHANSLSVKRETLFQHSLKTHDNRILVSIPEDKKEQYISILDGLEIPYQALDYEREYKAWEKREAKKAEKGKKCKGFLWLIITAIIVIPLCFWNIWYSINGKSTNRSDILTAVSGWVSGVATAGIGLLSFHQNKTYKEDTDEGIEKGYRFEQSQMVLKNRMSLIQTTKDAIDIFEKENNCESLLQNVLEMSLAHNLSKDATQENRLKIKVTFYFYNIGDRCAKLKSIIRNDIIASAYKELAIASIDKYFEVCSKFDLDVFNDPKKCYDEIHTKIYPHYLECTNQLGLYYLYLNDDIKQSLQNIRNTEYILTHYQVDDSEE